MKPQETKHNKRYLLGWKNEDSSSTELQPVAFNDTAFKMNSYGPY